MWARVAAIVGWAEQASFLGLSFFAMIIVAISTQQPLLAMNIVHEAESQSEGVAENCGISDKAIEKQFLLTKEIRVSADSAERIGIQIVGEILRGALIWRSYYPPGHHVSSSTVCGHFWRLALSDLSQIWTIDNFDNPCRSAPVVFENMSIVPFLNAIVADNNRQERSFQFYERFLSHIGRQPCSVRSDFDNSNLAFTSEIQPNGCNPQTNCRNSENASESDQPRRKVCDGIASCLFPKPIIFLFLCGAFVGCGIVAWAIIEWQNDEDPNRKRD